MHNSGFQIIGEALSGRRASSFIVVGLSRGGTSAIAASLDALGIPMGKNFHKPIYEDIDLAGAFRAKNWRGLKKIIRKYEADYPKFGWKLPDNYKQLDRLHRYFSNPFYIFVYRDIFAIASRRALVHGTDTFRTMHGGLAHYKAILDFARKRKPIGLHVSYEKLIHNREEYVKILAEFCGVELTADRLEAAIKATDPYPDSYKQWTDALQQRELLRNFGFDGNIESITEKSISGWFLQLDKEEAVFAEIAVNHKVVGCLQCDLFRGDLIEAGLSTSGRAGFTLDLVDGKIQAGDHIQVRVKGMQFGLTNIYNG